MTLRNRLRRLEDRAVASEQRVYTAREWLAILEDAETEAGTEIFDFSECVNRLRLAMTAHEQRSPEVEAALNACLDRVRWFAYGMGFTRAEWVEARRWIMAAWNEPSHPAHGFEVQDRPEPPSGTVRLNHLYQAVRESEALPARGAGEIVWAVRQLRARRGQ